MRNYLFMMFVTLSFLHAEGLSQKEGKIAKEKPKTEEKSFPQGKEGKKSQLECFVDEAMAHSQKQFKDVHLEALRVWKNFKKGVVPNYTYRTWGRYIVEWLKTEKSLDFTSLDEVRAVFLILQNKEKISKDAVSFLSEDSWGYMQYKYGVEPQRKKEEERSTSQNSNYKEI